MLQTYNNFFAGVQSTHVNFILVHEMTTMDGGNVMMIGCGHVVHAEDTNIFHFGLRWSERTK